MVEIVVIYRHQFVGKDNKLKRTINFIICDYIRNRVNFKVVSNFLQYLNRFVVIFGRPIAILLLKGLSCISGMCMCTDLL